ncbi:MAG: hypothetical protein K2X35_03580 [Bryobacteraceae bacterium]|nr:hypothetical protein [Bryobacteraceae bacterium]
MIRTITTDGTAVARIQTEEQVLDVPSLFGRRLRPGDRIAQLGPDGFVAEMRGAKLRWLHAPIGYAAQPKQNKNGEWMVRAETANCPTGPKTIIIAGDALRRYFYQASDLQTLYDILGCSPESTIDALRIAWRVKNLELSASLVASNGMIAERAFNLLAHPDLRKCYDALLTDGDAAPIFPYGGFGLILVEGDFSQDGTAFFANAILAFRPEVKLRIFSVLLRQCEFLADRIVCRDPRRRIEVSLDAGLLGGLQWDLTWNQWRQWLKSRIEVDAAFVQSGKYQFTSGEWKLRKWLTALPSRLRVKVAENLGEDVARARAIHYLLGEHADVVQRIREEIERQPVEHSTVQRWFDELAVSPALKPQHVAWHADFDAYYFDQLRRRATTWYLFGREFLFVLPNVIVAEIPQAGHATYVFAKPKSLDAFMRRYGGVTRDDIRHNRANRASDLGFVGRVVRGKRKKRWLASILKLAGEKADYVEALE